MAGVRGVKPPRMQEASRQFRRELLEQKQNVQKNKEVLCDITTNRLDEAVIRLDQARERGEALGDVAQKSKDVSAQAEILRTLASYGVVAANKLVQQQQGRGPMELITALRAAFVHTSDPQLEGEVDPMAFCWAELAATTEHLRRPAPSAHCMLGPLDAKPKERKAPVQRQRQKQETAELARPVELDKIEENKDKQETDRNMDLMWEVIRTHAKPTVALSQLICNPQSFAQTVENFFTLLFLVKDNRVAMTQDVQRGIMVRPLQDGKQGENAAAGPSGKNAAASGVKHQFVCSFNINDWRVMCRMVPPAACLMPHREGGQAPAGGAAAGAAGESGAGGAAGGAKQRQSAASGQQTQAQPTKKQRR